MDSGVTIRRVTVSEAALLADLGARLFRQTYEAFNTAENLRSFISTSFSESLQLAELQDPDMTCLFAEDDGEIVGYVQMRKAASPCEESSPGDAELWRIYVDQSCHGRGIGKKLMDAVVTAAEEWKSARLWLGVWEKNDKALAFYERNGFAARCDHIFRVGDDDQRDIVMVRDLYG